MFRWLESQDPNLFVDGLYYSVWVYIPRRYTMTADAATGRYWNLLQFKSKHPCPDDHGKDCNDPIWFLSVQNRIPGSSSPMYLQLIWVDANKTMPGSFPGDGIGFKSFAARHRTDLPTNRWIKLTAYLKQAGKGEFSGRITMWQNDDLLFDLTGIDARYGDGDN